MQIEAKLEELRLALPGPAETPPGLVYLRVLAVSRSWVATWKSANPDQVSIGVMCADFGTPRQND